MKIEEKNRIIELFIATLNKTATEDQEKEFNNWLHNSAKNKKLFDDFNDPEFIKNGLNQYASFDTQENLIKFTQLKQKKRTHSLNRTLKYATSIAAALIAFTFVIYNLSKNEDEPKKIQVTHVAQNFTKPTLIVDNKVTELSSEINEIEINDKLTINNKNSQISYDNNDAEIVENKIIVPSMSNYSVKLEDGTVIILNANSELIYPSRFANNNRVVTLKGEAYFDVAKSKHPFIVNCVNTKIKVFGTRFNINTYSENRVKIFLVAGSVGVYSDKDITMMTPNQLSVVDELTNSNTITDVATSDQENIVGWLNDIFIFNNVDIGEVVKILSAWYGEELKVDNSRKETITARYKRDTPLDEIIKSLETITSKKIIK